MLSSYQSNTSIPRHDDDGGVGCAETGRTCASNALLPEVVELLPACSRRQQRGLTRGEMASVFDVSKRTIDRWEEKHAIPFEQLNARVIRYRIEAVVMLCSIGISLHRDNAARIGLIPDVILSLAAKQQRASQKALCPVADKGMNAISVFIPETEDDRRLLQLWSDPLKGQALRTLVRVLVV